MHRKGWKSGNKRRAVEKMDEERPSVHYTGPCTIGVCGEEAACKDNENNTFTCVCPHDSQPPTTSGTCPRKIVPVDPGRIPNVQPPSNKQSPQINSTIRRAPHKIAAENLASSNYIVLLVVGSVICLFVILLAIFLVKKFRNRHLNQSGASPINLKQSLLVPDRYTPNPQYSACTATGVPLLRKETLKFLNVIGEGCFGKVYKGEMTITEGEKIQFVAIKVLKENATRENEDDFIREVEIMSAFKHPNILCLLGMVTNDGTASPMMVFEFMPHGDLAELLRSQKDPYDEKLPKIDRKHLLSIALQIANGMKYLAAQRFVHRDLACRNCLVAEGPVVKIADFGMSRDVYTSDYYRIGGSRLLPVRWMSPESVLYGRFTLESDVWSYGIVLWEIYSYGKQPYYGHTNDEAVRLIIDGIMLIPPDDCPSLICELMKNCWKTEGRDRIKFPNICDKLELAYESLSDDYETDSSPSSNNRNKFTSLPRPPPLLPLPMMNDLLDSQGYLLANEVNQPVQYLETLPD